MTDLVYVASFDGRPTPQVHHQRQTDGNGKLQKYLQRVTIKPEEESLSVEELAKRYPFTAGAPTT